MATFTKVFPSNSSYRLELTVTESSLNKWSNLSRVSWSLAVRKTSGSGYWSNYTHSWSVNIGGTRRSGSINGYDFTRYSVLTLGSGWVDITHDAYGKKTINCSGEFNSEELGTIGYAYVPWDTSKLALTSYNRVGTLNSVPSSRVLGNTFNLGLTVQSGGLNHKVILKLSNGYQMYYFERSASSTISYTETENQFIDAMNNMKAGTDTITYIVETYSGSTRIGTWQKTGTVIYPNFGHTVTPTTVTLGDNLTFKHTGRPLKAGAYYKLMLVKTNNWTTVGDTVNITGQTGTLGTGNATAIREVLALAGTDTSLRVSPTVYCMNNKGVNIAWTEKSFVTINIPQASLSITVKEHIVDYEVTSKYSGNMANVELLEYSYDGGDWTHYATNPPATYTARLSGKVDTNNHTVRVRLKQAGYGVYTYSNTVTFRYGRPIDLIMPAKKYYYVNESIPIGYQSYTYPGWISLKGKTDWVTVDQRRDVAANKKGTVNFTVTEREMDKLDESIHFSDLNGIEKESRTFGGRFETIEGAQVEVIACPPEAMEPGYRRNIVAESIPQHTSPAPSWWSTSVDGNVTNGVGVSGRVTLDTTYKGKKGVTVLHCDKVGTHITLRQRLNPRMIPGRTYTLSFWYYLEDVTYGTTNVLVGGYTELSNQGTGWARTIFGGRVERQPAGQWHQYKETVDTSTFYALFKPGFSVDTYMYFRDIKGTIGFADFQITEGSEVTPWKKAFEDYRLGSPRHFCVTAWGGNYRLKYLHGGLFNTEMSIPGKRYTAMYEINNIGDAPITIGHNHFDSLVNLPSGSYRKVNATGKYSGTSYTQFRFEATNNSDIKRGITAVMHLPTVVKHEIDTGSDEYSYPLDVQSHITQNGVVVDGKAEKVYVSRGSRMFAYTEEEGFVRGEPFVWYNKNTFGSDSEFVPEQSTKYPVVNLTVSPQNNYIVSGMNRNMAWYETRINAQPTMAGMPYPVMFHELTKFSNYPTWLVRAHFIELNHRGQCTGNVLQYTPRELATKGVEPGNWLIVAESSSYISEEPFRNQLNYSLHYGVNGGMNNGTATYMVVGGGHPPVGRTQRFVGKLGGLPANASLEYSLEFYNLSNEDLGYLDLKELDFGQTIYVGILGEQASYRTVTAGNHVVISGTMKVPSDGKISLEVSVLGQKVTPLFFGIKELLLTTGEAKWEPAIAYQYTGERWATV